MGINADWSTIFCCNKKLQPQEYEWDPALMANKKVRCISVHLKGVQLGLKSELCAGHLSSFTLVLILRVFMDLSLYTRALSCWKEHAATLSRHCEYIWTNWNVLHLNKHFKMFNYHWEFFLVLDEVKKNFTKTLLEPVCLLGKWMKKLNEKLVASIYNHDNDDGSSWMPGLVI